MLFGLVVALLLAVIVAAVVGRRLTQARREIVRLSARLERFELQLPRTETPRSVDVSAMRREAQQVYVAREAEQLREVQAHMLADCRDAMGAEEAVLWCWNESADALRPADWSTEGPKPAFFDAAAWGPLIAWSLEDDKVQLAAESGIVYAGAAPMLLEGRPVGVLSVTSRKGLSRSRDEVRHWLPRLATEVAYVRDLVDKRVEYGQHMRKSQALLKAVQRLEADPSGESLTRSLCETAVDMTGSRGAALVRWHPSLDKGEVEYATSGLGLRAPATLGSDSQVAVRCREGTALVLEDARGRSTAHALYGVGRSVRDPGSVAILPIVRQGRVLGALVLEADEVNDFATDTPTELSVLLAMAASSLELAWSYGEVDRRSRTDPLTGLYNRAHFGEQLEEKLELADRHDQPVSLVMVDIDHFKRVNDTYGHEAGDAVLRRVAGLIQEAVRSTDVCVRYGGEEIALLLAQTPQSAAIDMAERLRERIAATVAFHKGATIPVTASFGISTYPETARVRDQLFPQADAALYRAKGDGRNCVRWSKTSTTVITA